MSQVGSYLLGLGLYDYVNSIEASRDYIVRREGAEDVAKAWESLLEPC